MFRYIVLSLITLMGHQTVANAQPTQGLSEGFPASDRGPWRTGTMLVTWTDDNREEYTTDEEDDNRRLLIQIWYPAEHSPDAPKAPYALNVLGYDARLHPAAAAPPSNSVLDADLAGEDKRFPVLLYSHGRGSPIFLSSFQTEYLASHGYVVVGVGHTGMNALLRFPDGDEYQPNFDMWRPSSQDEHLYEAAVADIGFVLDRLEGLNTDPSHKFYQQLDLDRIGALGWSMGGATALQAASVDGRIDAALNLDGGIDGSVVQTGLNRPLMVVQDEQGSVRPPEGVIEAQSQADRVESELKSWRMISHSDDDWYFVTIPGTHHTSFSDKYFYEPRPEGVLSPQQVHPVINAVVLAFVERYVKGDEGVSIADLTEHFPEVRIATGE